jgi:hypothetical protein
MQLAHIVHRVATDPAFAAYLLHDPHAALYQAQTRLDEQQLAVLLSVLREHPRWAELCSPAVDPSEERPWY